MKAKQKKFPIKNYYSQNYRLKICVRKHIVFYSISNSSGRLSLMSFCAFVVLQCLYVLVNRCIMCLMHSYKLDLDYFAKFISFNDNSNSFII